jgi:membrane-bound serine protease (ClpP class)
VLELFIVLVIGGLMLMGIELFVPGGLIGTIGVFCLLGAVGIGFSEFGQEIGWLIAIGILVLLGIATYLWLKVFPRTRLGKRMTVSAHEADFKAMPDYLDTLVGSEGDATTDLRPVGFANIGGKRVDVVSVAGIIPRGTRVKVVKVEGFKVLVKAVESAGQ